MTGRSGLRLMWIGTAVNCAVAVVQIAVFDYLVVQSLAVVGAVLAVCGAVLANRGDLELGRGLVFVSAVVFFPVGVMAALGVQQLRDDWVRSKAAYRRRPEAGATPAAR